MNNELLVHHVFLYAINLILIILNLLITIKTRWVNCRPTGDPWVPVDLMDTSLGTKLNPWWVMDFLMGMYCIRAHGFGQAKPGGFRPAQALVQGLLVNQHDFFLCWGSCRKNMVSTGKQHHTMSRWFFFWKGSRQEFCRSWWWRHVWFVFWRIYDL